jgi:predicted nuclease with TOPRIM domain
VREAVAEIRRLKGRQEDERKTAMDNLHKKAQEERSEVSGLTEVLRNLDGKHERIPDTVAMQGDEVFETCQRNEELGGHVQPLEEENQLHGNQTKS